MASQFRPEMESRIRNFSTQLLDSISAISSPTPARGSPVPSPASTLISTTTRPSSVETIASIEGGKTVYITVTHSQEPTTRADVATPTAQTASQNRNDGNSKAGPIAGGVIGGLTLLSAAIFVVFLLRRKKRANEWRQATLPPPYAAADMSEELQSGTPTISSSTPSGTGVTEKAGLRNDEGNIDAVPQLDSTMIRPVTEIGGDPLGNIPELPATAPSRDGTPLGTQRESSAGYSKTQKEGENKAVSWTQFNSLGNWATASRLFQPHDVPDASAPVWENMFNSRKSEEKSES
ncbi:hypothetical protein B0J11DRAFT_331114 [Dendryphion nanum]|uniref:Uncharacterized protein n=1 Tax=Dendryphion nanum TaxID=256645 RepID=A0A9P9IJ66_9PLEO|nr:hypothetical protein B0J11DRAFT_331114 [Dendryphion nanum]